jgi:hypothetical protein
VKRGPNLRTSSNRNKRKSQAILADREVHGKPAFAGSGLLAQQVQRGETGR